MDEIKLPDFYFKFHVASLKFLGIDVLVKNESVAYRIYSIFALFFTGSFVFVECIELIYHTDFNELAHVCNYAISHFLGMIKLIVLYRNRKEIGKLLVSLHEGVYKPNEERGGLFERRCIRDTLKQNNFLMWVYAHSIFVVVTLGLVTSLKARITKPREMWRLGFSYISIVDTSYTPAFEIAYVYQSLGIFMITLCVYSSDVTVISIIAQATAQLKILDNSIRYTMWPDLLWRWAKNGTSFTPDHHTKSVHTFLLHLVECGRPVDVYTYFYTCRTYIQRGSKSAEQKGACREESVNDALRDSIYNHHYAILTTVSTIEDLCCYLALCVFLANLVLLCLLMYKTSMLPLASLLFVMYLAYCFLIAIQVFLYCWWGNEMTWANEKLALGISQTYTPDVPISHAMALKLMMIRSQRTLCLTAGKFAPLSLETYKGIIKGSFSYFMVLRQVNAK